MGAYFLESKQSEGRLSCPHCGSTDCAGFDGTGGHNRLICCITGLPVTVEQLQAADHALYWNSHRVGTIVLAQGGAAGMLGVGGERIVGVVLDADTEGFNEVLWLSDQRGAFTCTEAPGDLTPASLSGRADMADTQLDHLALAGVLLKWVQS